MSARRTTIQIVDVLAKWTFAPIENMTTMIASVISSITHGSTITVSAKGMITDTAPLRTEAPSRVVPKQDHC
jgi:hypothetical protein